MTEVGVLFYRIEGRLTVRGRIIDGGGPSVMGGRGGYLADLRKRLVSREHLGVGGGGSSRWRDMRT